MTVHTGTGKVELHDSDRPDWTVDLVDTGNATLTGGRIKRLREFLGNATFMLTWGDGVSDVDLRALLAFHRSHGKLATVTAVRPPARFGYMEFSGDCVSQFTEKPQTARGMDQRRLLRAGAEGLRLHRRRRHHVRARAAGAPGGDGQLMAYKHTSFWQCMDTLRDKHVLQKLWDSGHHPGGSGAKQCAYWSPVTRATSGHASFRCCSQKGSKLAGWTATCSGHARSTARLPKSPRSSRTSGTPPNGISRASRRSFTSPGCRTIPLGDYDPSLTEEINSRASIRLAELAKNVGVNRFVFSSSCSNYGAAGDNFLDEGAAFNPVTPYGVSKVNVERAVTKLASESFSPTFLAHPRPTASRRASGSISW